MTKRIYYVFPNKMTVRHAVDELLIKCIDIKHIHVHAREDVDLSSLPEASIFQTSDFRHSLLIGLVVGVFLGIGIGLAFHYALGIPLGGLMIVTTLIGAVLSAWGSTMIGLMAQNVELRPFKSDLDAGNYLLMVDVPNNRLQEIEDLLGELHPEAKFNGQEPTIPPFP